MPTPQDLEDAKNAVREIEQGQGAPADPSPQPQGTPDTPKEPTSPGEPSPPAQETPSQVPPAPSPEAERLQKLEEENRRLQEELDRKTRQQAQVPPPEPTQGQPQPQNPLERFSDDDLIRYKVENPDYAIQIEKELHKRTQDRATRDARKTFEAQRLQDSYNAAADRDFPGLRDPNSDLAKLTQQIMASDASYSQHPQGKYVAAMEADRRLTKQELERLKSQGQLTEDQRRAAQQDAERQKVASSLEGSGRAPAAIPTVETALEESENKLGGARANTPELLEHMRVLEKKKQKQTA